MRALVSCSLVLAASLAFATGAAAQQRPLVTQDPETIGSGHILVEAGFDYGRDIFFPVSGLKGNLLRVPLVGVMFGLGPIAELQVTGGLHNRLSIKQRLPAPLSDLVTATGDTTTDFEDIVVGTKIRLAAETESRPAFALRIATRLPNASNENGIGTDTMDFYASVLGGKTIRSFRAVANLGVGILSDPTRGDRQNDVLTFGLSLARALSNQTEVVGEINGRANTRSTAFPGTESRAVMRLGARYTRGAARLDAAGLIGFTDRDPGIGFTVGVSYIFQAFNPK